MGTVATAFVAVRSIRHGLSRSGDGYYDLVVTDATAKLAGKIWGDTRAYKEATVADPPGDPATAVKPGAIVKLLFTVASYRDALQLTVTRIRVVDQDDPCQPEAIWGPGWELVEGLRCETLVFDIETVPAIDLGAVPEAVTKAVSRAAERNDGDAGKVMSLSPYYGKVVSLAFGDADTDTDTVTTLVVPPQGREQDPLPDGVRAMTEAELLRSFWHLADAAELVVSFNGRGFDVPFLVTRSLILGVPARVDLVSSPFSLRPHLDLYRVLGHGRSSLGGASLDVICWALGVESPKGELDGSMVAPTYARGDIEAIAAYNAADVRATAAVFRHLREHLLPFRNDW
ncbi:hypothetical protein DB30_00444 [Enhygromyxa salina]|uniref:Predicted 3'-5' exonuclease PolB-like domain-containing protein n=1 Tax=Enhygromyxa salina TaxID=215803 RepID=A0A0C2CPY2_9BACT|nr:hypothetical protein DB30_00444 [Enhygromyxa salina]